jgi:hypothetical protein
MKPKSVLGGRIGPSMAMDACHSIYLSQQQCRLLRRHRFSKDPTTIMSGYLKRPFSTLLRNTQCFQYRTALPSRRALSYTPRCQDLQATPRPQQPPASTISVPKSSKVWSSAEEAVKNIPSGSMILSAGKQPYSWLPPLG